MKISRIERAEIPAIKSYQTCRVKSCGNIVEIMSRQHQGKPQPYIKRISKDSYIDTRTSEIFDYKHIENRADNMQTVAQSLSRLRDLLNTNITDVTRCRWITLTYAENMTDTKKLYQDFKYFNTKCRAKFGHYEYIVAAEPQGRGAWHMHCVFMFNGKAPYMPNEVVAQLWGKGFVTVKKLDDVDNVGAYLTAYLGDMEMTPDLEKSCPDGFIKEVPYEEDGVKKTKRYIKGARLSMYPPKFNIYRFSRGVKKPLIEEMCYQDAKKKVRDAAQTFNKAVKLDDEKGFTDTIVYEYYNAVRGKSQEKNQNSQTKLESAETKLDEQIEEKPLDDGYKTKLTLARKTDMLIWVRRMVDDKHELEPLSESHARAVLSEKRSDLVEVTENDTDIWQQF